MNEKQLNTLAKLQMFIAVNKAKILSNPEPYFNQMNDEIIRAVECFHKLEYALSPDLTFDVATEMKIPPADFCGADYIAVRKAKEILADYFNGR